jgi:hypothetical protein
MTNNSKRRSPSFRIPIASSSASTDRERQRQHSTSDVHVLVSCPSFDRRPFTISIAPHGPYALGDVTETIALTVRKRGGPNLPVSALTVSYGDGTPVPDVLRAVRPFSDDNVTPFLLVKSKTRYLSIFAWTHIDPSYRKSAGKNALRTLWENARYSCFPFSYGSHCSPEWDRSVRGKRSPKCGRDTRALPEMRHLLS